MIHTLFSHFPSLQKKATSIAAIPNTNHIINRLRPPYVVLLPCLCFLKNTLLPLPLPLPPLLSSPLTAARLVPNRARAKGEAPLRLRLDEVDGPDDVVVLVLEPPLEDRPGPA